MNKKELDYYILDDFILPKDMTMSLDAIQTIDKFYKQIGLDIFIFWDGELPWVKVEAIQKEEKLILPLVRNEKGQEWICKFAAKIWE